MTSPCENSALDGAQGYKVTWPSKVVGLGGGIGELDGGEGAIVR